MLHRHKGDGLPKLSDERQVFRFVRLSQPAVVIIMPELSVSTLAGIDIGEFLEVAAERERFGLFPAVFLRDILLDDGPVILHPLFHQEAEGRRNRIRTDVDKMQRLGGNLDQATKQRELVGGVFGFVAQDAQQILVDVVSHGAIISPPPFGGQGG